MANTALEKRRRSALQILSEHLLGRGATPLSVEQIRSTEKTAKEGWTLNSGEGDLMILLTDDWPFVPPECFIGRDHPKFGSAHVGSDGKLCLAPPHSVYSQANPVELLEALLEQAQQLLTRDDAASEELVDEFQSYWLRDMQPKRTCLSLLKPQGPSRMVACWHGDKQSVYGESEDAVRDFVQRRHGLKSNPLLSEEPFLWFARGLVPQEFPRRARRIWELTRELSPDGLALLPPVVAKPLSRIAFGFDTANGAALAAVTLRRPANFTKGFREHRMCQAVAVSRFFGSEKAEGCLVQRVDHEWIHSRGGEARNTGLHGKKVAILGCGSLGSGVAMLLAKSGVGNLVMVDGETLSWNNIGRHALGASSVDQNKAAAMAAEIQRQLPSVNARGIAKTWQEARRSGDMDLSKMDLIISTSGDWPADSMLNFGSRTEMEFPPLIVTWFEPHALAGHALMVGDFGGCFACGTDEFGNFSHRLTEWPQGAAFQREPACGGYYQPYGPGQMVSTHGLAATLAVDVLTSGMTHSELRSWVAAKARIESAGGQWTQRVNEAGVALDGGFITEKWPVSPTCQLC